MDIIFYPIKLLADWLVFSILAIAHKTLLAEAINFFIYDTIKIFILLAVIIFIVSIIRSYLPPEKIRLVLARKNKYLGNLLASLLGIITPFCSCSAIPLFLGFVQAGVPLGTTFSFLVASPMINEVALVLLLGMFGWKIALLYILSGLIISVLSGIIIGKMKVENLVKSFVYPHTNNQLNNNGQKHGEEKDSRDYKASNNIGVGVYQNTINPEIELSKMSWSDRLAYARGYTWDIIKKVGLYIIIGVGLGALIHGYVPTDFLAKYAGAGEWYAVPFAVLIGIPLYSNAAGIIPLVGALTEKGVAMGTTMAFMMAVTALSLPEFMILKRVMKTKLILIFAAIVGLGIILTGYLFNWIL